MGVHKLWDILLTIATPKQVSDLSGLILAIDASLWIVKVNSIYQNIDEGLKCIFNKLLWLKKSNIKPIFVFDGQTPMLKRRTIQQRRNRRKQINQFDLTKKVQIQIVKKITGVQPQKSQTQASTYAQKTKELDQILNNLLQYSYTTNTIQLSQKISLQAEVLNKKYQLFNETLPNLTQKYGTYDYFNSLDIQIKQEILDDIQTNQLPSRRDIRLLKQSMSQQQKIMYDMELIKKKSKIRELQDNLYRKMMTKKIQNGYEIIEGVYNGKKVVQKRRVKQKSFDEWAMKGNKKQTCNNFKQIFDQNKKVSLSKQNSVLEDEQNPNFFARIFNKNYTQQKRQSSTNTFEQISQRLSQSTSHRQSRTHQFLKNSGNYRRSHQKIFKKQQQNDQIQYDNIFDQVEPKNKSQANKNQSTLQNDPDNLPDYIMMQKLDELNTSNHNIHLQNMLDILGINYIVAPFQAEAQCAALQQMGLVDGIVTQDSDSFLFGARKVYRGLFQDNIKLYSMSKIEQKLFLARQKLILFGLMLGSDYTDGIKGIGIVNAMQILKIHHDIDSLTKFTQWARNSDVLQENDQLKTDYMLQSAMSQDERQFYKLHRKFKNYWHVHPSFPQRNIYEAYMQPEVQSGEKLQKKVKQNKKFEIDGLKKLMQQKFKMVPTQLDINIKILTKPFQKKTQTEITDFVQGGFATIVSKRLQKAIKRDYTS